ncbi:ribonuclease HI family protein [Nitrogeniibacter aestuarii]|uniref:ribonuclease HI family protein n=1 Tax=Nitrogeniibacter aestuarii TaxID=2815343 RepID=UPI001D0F817D|nr:ribonuclease HI family protein [Nitrogeniibacter aestuarii]
MGALSAVLPPQPAVAPAEAVSLWRLWIDGTAVPNPGALGMGVVLEAPDGSTRRESLRGHHGCSNAAELHALIHGLALARDAGITALTIFSDSDFVVRHVGGEQQTRSERLRELVLDARKALHAFEHAELFWIPRHRNSEADTLARGALGLAPKPANRPISRKRRP